MRSRSVYAIGSAENTGCRSQNDRNLVNERYTLTSGVPVAQLLRRGAYRGSER